MSSLENTSEKRIPAPLLCQRISDELIPDEVVSITLLSIFPGLKYWAPSELFRFTHLQAPACHWSYRAFPECISPADPSKLSREG